MATSQRASLLPAAENHRHGRVSGDGGLTKIVRTFHARFGSVKLGGAVTARTRIAYVHREGQHAKDAGDVEATAGDKEKVIEAADRIRDTARVRRGKTAERLLATQVIELPLESTAEQRQACAEAFVADWRGRGHQAVAVVHVHGEEHKQPHLHVEIAARPVHADGSVDRSATRLWAGGHPAVEVKKERQRVADIVNRTCEPDPPYHPGGFRDIGVERQPRTRIPAGKFRDARAEIREAPEKAAEIEAKAYATSDKERGEKREARLARTAEIIEFRAAGLPARPSQRARLAFAEPALKAERARTREAREGRDAWYHYYEKRKAGEKRRGEERDEQRTRADTAEGRVRELEDRQVQPLALTEKQMPVFEEVRTRYGFEGSIHDAQVQLLIFDKMHEEREARKRREAETARAAALAEKEKIAEAVRLAREDEKKQVEEEAVKEIEWWAGRTDKAEDEKKQAETRADKAETRVRELETLEDERQEQNRDGRGTGEAGGDGRRPDQGADRPGTEARRGGGAEDHGAGRAERPRAGGDRPEGDDGREQTGGVGQPASAGGPHAVDGNVGGDRGAAPARGREGVESHVVAAPGREDAEGLAREHGLVEEPGVVERPADRRGDGDGARVGDDGGSDWNWLLDLDDANPLRRLAGRPDLAAPPSDVVASRPGGDAGPVTPPEAAKPEKTEPPARPWKDLSDDELVNHWGGASRRRRAATTDENKDDARRKIEELHAEAKHRNTTLKTLAARKQRRDDRGL